MMSQNEKILARHPKSFDYSTRFSPGRHKVHCLLSFQRFFALSMDLH